MPNNNISLEIPFGIATNNKALQEGLWAYKEFFDFTNRKIKDGYSKEYSERRSFVVNIIDNIRSFLKIVENKMNQELDLRRILKKVEMLISTEEKAFPRFYVCFSPEKTPGELIIQGLKEILEEFKK